MKENPELRLTVTDNIYYAQPGADPKQIDASYSRFIRTNEQIYERITHASTTWNKIGSGWIEGKASLVTIRNRYTRDVTNRNPTQAEIEETKKHILEVSFSTADTADILIYPGESCRFTPKDLSRLKIRSAYGLTRYICSIAPE